MRDWREGANNIGRLDRGAECIQGCGKKARYFVSCTENRYWGGGVVQPGGYGNCGTLWPESWGKFCKDCLEQDFVRLGLTW